jgi:hypothetical protein
MKVSKELPKSESNIIIVLSLSEARALVAYLGNNISALEFQYMNLSVPGLYAALRGIIRD